MIGIDRLDQAGNVCGKGLQDAAFVLHELEPAAGLTSASFINCQAMMVGFALGPIHDLGDPVAVRHRAGWIGRPIAARVPRLVLVRACTAVRAIAIDRLV